MKSKHIIVKLENDVIKKIFLEDMAETVYHVSDDSLLVGTNSASGGRWSSEREYYRLNRLHLAELSSEEYDDGFPVVVTKGKLRGKGKVVSLKFSTSPGKDCRLQGWTMLMALENAPRG